jgi:hypothetical protein
MAAKKKPAPATGSPKFLVLLHMYEGARGLLRDPDFLSPELKKSCETIVAQWELFRDMRKQIDKMDTLPELKKHTEDFLRKHGIPPDIPVAAFTPDQKHHRKKHS